MSGTLSEAMERVTQLKDDSWLLLHPGDVSQLSRAGQFDTAEQIIKSAGLDTHYVPGEHDVFDEDGKAFFEGFTKGASKGYYSFDQQGVHFVGLNNVQDLKAGGLGNLRREQLEWLKRDLRGHPSSQPIVIDRQVADARSTLRRRYRQLRFRRWCRHVGHRLSHDRPCRLSIAKAGAVSAARWQRQRSRPNCYC